MKKRILISCLLLAAVPGCESKPATTPKSPSQIEVTLEIDFQGRADNLNGDYKIGEDSTVFELLQIAQAANDLRFQHQGSGETAFIQSFNEVANEKANGSNWVFMVNQKLSNKGCGSTNISDGDRVTWKFADSYRPSE